MKTKITTFVLAALTAAIFAGCRTPQPCRDNPNSPECIQARANQAQRITDSLGFTGATLAIRDNPAWRPHLDDAAHALDLLTQRPDITLADIYAALQVLPFAEVHTPEALLILANGQIILEELGIGYIPLHEAPILQAAAQGLALGIRRATGQLGPPPPPAPLPPGLA